MKKAGLGVLACISLLFVLTFSPALAAPLGANAVDGDGLMAVSPSNVTYGTTSTTLTFTFTANNDFGAGSQVEITIPSGWTPPITGAGAGHLSWSSGTCMLSGGPPVAVAGMDIFIDMASCLTGQSFTVTYAGVTPGNISGSPYTFLTHTDIGPGGGGLTPINAGSPTVTIDPKALTVSNTGLTPASKVYDGNTAATLTLGNPTLAGIIGSDSVTLLTGGATGAFIDRNVGTNKEVIISGLTLSGAQAANYSLVQPTRHANISAKPLTVSAVTDSKVYDGTVNSSQAPVISASTPLVPGDSASGITQDFNNKRVGTGKTISPVGVVLDGNGGANYAYTYVAVTTGTITQRPVIVTAVTDTKTYDGTTSSGGIPLLSGGTPLAPGDTAPVWTQAFDSAAAGTGKLLIPAGSVVDGNGGKNYAYTFVNDSTGVINLRAVTINADPKTKTVGAPDPSLSYQITNGSLVTGDTLMLARTAGETPGAYPITVGSFPAASNYSLTYTGADLTIVPAPTFTSVGTYDGWVLESTRTSSLGGFRNATGITFQLGDDAANRQYRAILSFDTSGLPDNAIVTKAVLRIKQAGPPLGLNPFSSLGGLLVDIRKGTFGTLALAPSDFQASASAMKVGMFGKTSTAGWYKVVLNTAGRKNINRAGPTQLRLYFALGDNNNLRADFMKFNSGNATADAPQLIITYLIP